MAISVWSFSKKQLLQSLLVGVPQIIHARGYFRKFLKALVLILCLGCCIYQTWSYMSVYWSYPVIVDVSVSYPNRIAAPAFSICNHNGLKRFIFCQHFPNLCTPRISYGNFCTVHFSFCGKTLPKEEPLKMPVVVPMELPTNNTTFRKTYRRIGTGIIDFIDSVEYNEEKFASPEIFSVFNMEGLPTNCFAYNTLWGKKPPDVKIVDQTDAFKIILKSSSKDHFYTVTPLAIQMVIHPQLKKVNPFTDGFSLRPCTTYNMYLRKVKKFLLPPPYPTNCTDYYKRRKDQGYGPLSQKSCIEECTFNRSISKYGCFDPYKINFPNEEEKFCSTGSIVHDFDDCSKDCSPGCYEEEMDVKIEELVYPLTEKKNSGPCLTVINLLFSRIQETTYTYSKKYQVVEAFGYVGGFLGMWLGLSLIALCDFVETCCVIILYAFRKMKLNRRRRAAKVEFVSSKHLVHF